MDLLSSLIRIALATCWAVLCFATFAPWATGQGTTQVLVATGELAPGASEMFAGLSVPALNNAGQVSFHATLTGAESKNEGIYRAGGPGPSVQIARKGRAIPVGVGTFSAFTSRSSGFPALMNNQGQVAFHADISSPLFSQGIFRGDGSDLVRIAIDHQDAPDGNGVFSSFSEVSLVFNDVGQVGFTASLSGTSGGSLDSSGVFRGDGNVLAQILRQGDSAPDGDGTFSASRLIRMNDLGQVVFEATLADTDNNRAIFLGAGGDVRQVARAGTSTSDGNGTWQNMFSPAVNNSAEVVIQAWRTGTFGGANDGLGLFRISSTGAVTPVALDGQPSPDGNGVFVSFIEVVDLNDRGDAAFLKFLDDPLAGDVHSGIFLNPHDSSALKVVMRNGQPAPDGNGQLDGFLAPGLNNYGQVVAVAVLEETVIPGMDDRGIYLGDGVELARVAREGQSLAGSTITSLDFAHSPIDATGAGKARGLNDFAQVAYQATLADGREVIALFTPDVRWRNDIGGAWDDAANWTLSIPPGAVHKVRIDPPTNLTVLGPATHAAVKSLAVGGGSGLATLDLRPGGTLAASDGVTIDTGGLLTGSGAIIGRLSVQVGGELAVSAGETITVSGAAASENRNRVLVSGGTLNFLNFANVDAFINHPKSLVVGQGTLRTNSRLSNRGLMLFNGTTNILGDVENVEGAFLATSGGTTTFFGDVVNKAEIRTSSGGFTIFFGSVSGGGTFTGGGTVVMEGDLSPGASPAEIDFAGDIVFGRFSKLEIELGGTTPGTQHDMLDVAGRLSLGGTLEVSLIDGFAPTAGSTFDILDWAALSGTFDALVLPALGGSLHWDASRLYATGVLSVSGPSFTADFDEDGDVDGADLAQWRGDFSMNAESDADNDGDSDGADFLAWQQQLGSVPAAPAAGAVPEPNVMILVAIGMTAPAMLRGKRQR